MFWKNRQEGLGLADKKPESEPSRPHVSQMCADCYQVVRADGVGHSDWCIHYLRAEFPRLDPSLDRPARLDVRPAPGLITRGRS